MHTVEALKGIKEIYFLLDAIQISLVSRPSTTPLFDHFQYANTTTGIH